MTDLDILYEEVFGEEELKENINLFYERAISDKDLDRLEVVAHVHGLNTVCNILLSTLATINKKGVDKESIPENSREKIIEIRTSVRSMIKSGKYNLIKAKILYKRLDVYYKPIFNVAKKNKIKMQTPIIGGDFSKRNYTSTDQIMKMIHDGYVKEHQKLKNQQQKNEERIDKLLDLF